MGGGNLIAVFCDTGWEHPDTYKHVNDVCLQMGVRLITLKSKYDFVSLAVHKKRFPSTNARFCTSELKMKPMIDYVLSLKESCIIIQGIRAGESTARAAMEEECMYFKSYFQPNKKGRTEKMSKNNIAQQYNSMVASIEDAKIYDGRGEYNLYECNKCNNYKVTLYKDKGVTPFIMRCKCGGDMMHTKSSKQAPPSYVKVYNWVRPNLEQTMSLSEGMRNHILNGGLILEDELK